MVTCPRCKLENDEDAVFCAECGARLPQFPKHEVPRPPARPQREVSVPMPPPRQAYQPSPQPVQPQARRGTNALVIIGGIILGLMLVSVFFYTLIPRPDPYDPYNPCDYCASDESCVDGECVSDTYDPCDYCAWDEECVGGVCQPIDNGNGGDDAPEPTVLFGDDFSPDDLYGSFPGTNWVSFGTPPQLDWSTGFDGQVPSLRFLAFDWYSDPSVQSTSTGADSPSQNPGGPMAAGTWDPIRTAVNPFTTESGLAVQMAVLVPQSKDAGTLTLQVRGQSSESSAAMVKYYGYTKRISFSIRLPDGVTSETAFPVDANWHVVAFLVDGQGNAWWVIDDVVQLSTAGFPNDNYVVEVEGSPLRVTERPAGAERSYYYVDNVYVHDLNQA